MTPNDDFDFDNPLLSVIQERRRQQAHIDLAGAVPVKLCCLKMLAEDLDNLENPGSDVMMVVCDTCKDCWVTFKAEDGIVYMMLPVADTPLDKLLQTKRFKTFYEKKCEILQAAEKEQ